MPIIICGPDAACEILLAMAPGACIRVGAASAFTGFPDAAAFFNLDEDAAKADYSLLQQPVFINAVTTTLRENHLPAHVFRINGWPGFLERTHWEIAGVLTAQAAGVLAQLNRQPVVVADEPGLVAARVIAMIINEAYFALSAAVSSKEEIDTAMKLGTNYPYGPFEWASKIGADKIAGLLTRLSETDTRYQPCTLLMQESKQSVA